MKNIFSKIIILIKFFILIPEIIAEFLIVLPMGVIINTDFKDSIDWLKQLIIGYLGRVGMYMNIEKFYNQLEGLIKTKNFIVDNYDSNINITIEASSYHNYNNKILKKIFFTD